MNISDAAKHSGVPPKTIRYYESIGLIDEPLRSENGYRAYRDEDVHSLRFVQRARSLGFSVQDCRQLLALYKDPGRASADVKAMAELRIAEIDQKVKELTSMRTTLSHLAAHCHGNEKPACPILDDLAATVDDSSSPD
ncbi:MAG: Cu(I)-responsive transcriptional regulator [Geminicoccales bacterium]